MQDGEDKITPLAGRVVLGKKEAVTSAVFVVILLNMVILVIVRVAMLLIPSGLQALFWVLLAILLFADVALSPLCFYYAVNEVKENNAAPPYTVAIGGDGMLYLYHRDGRIQNLNPQELVKITARVAHVDWNSFAGGAGRGYGSLGFVVKSQMGRIVKYRVKYVVNCKQAAIYLSGLFVKEDLKEEQN
ncbi:MAG: hypothetical protein LUF82_00360 [Clostridia bacterium]|nr:hypothetical protein [Clostridia bacterium]